MSVVLGQAPSVRVAHRAEDIVSTRLVCPRSQQEVARSDLWLATLSNAFCGVADIFLTKHFNHYHCPIAGCTRTQGFGTLRDASHIDGREKVLQMSNLGLP